MEGIIEYAQRELVTFSQAPLHEVDSLLFSQLCYLGFIQAFAETCQMPGVPLHDAYHREAFDQLFGGRRAEEQNLALLTAIAASPRYRDVNACFAVDDFDPSNESQFAAITFVLPDGAGTYVAFRGTDASLVGWKENFNIAYRYPVPGQVAACEYLSRVAAAVEGPLYVGGHSKGGNLAIYAATLCGADVQDRIVAVFDHDAPGFAAEFYESPSFARIRARIRKTIPQDALVGMLMETLDGYRVVQSSGIAVLQHDPFTWGVNILSRDFELAQGVSAIAERSDAVISKWIEPLDSEQRGVFIDTLFKVLAATGAQSMGDLAHVGPLEIAAAAEALIDIDPETRRIILEVVARLVRIFFTPRVMWDAMDAAGGDADAADADMASENPVWR